MAEALESLLEYHQSTKHRPNAYARGPGMLDWANEPNPFRHYLGVQSVPLSRSEIDMPNNQPAPLDVHSLSNLFFNSLALSAWKSAMGSTWSLRVNPSSGDLHPTECYLISGKIIGFEGSPGFYHYTPESHALGMPDGSFLMGAVIDILALVMEIRRKSLSLLSARYRSRVSVHCNISSVPGLAGSAD